MSDFAVVGTGAVAAGLAKALVHAGFAVRGLAGRRPQAAAQAAAFAGCPVLPWGEVQADWVFLATRAGAIAEVSGGVSARVLAHLSGALAASVMSPRASRVSMHPCASMPDPETAFHRLRNGWFGVEGDEQAVAEARGIVERLGSRSFAIRGDKALYHAGACVAANYLVTLAAAAQALWAEGGVEADGALYDLMQGTLDNLRARGPAAALTGPIRRHDADTVRRHLETLREHESPWRQLYRQMGQETLRLSPDPGLQALFEGLE